MTFLKNIFSNFKRYSFLMKQLISRDFKVKYKRSVLGVVWSLLYPVLMMAVMAIVFSQMFKFKTEGTNYIVYLMTGLILFNYFSEASQAAMTSVISNFSLINKVYIPKYIFPIAKCLFVGINFLLTLIPWLIIIFLTRFGLGDYYVPFNIWYILLPYIFLCFLFFTMGIGLLLATFSVFLRDVVYIYGIVITLWNYLTPVFWSLEILPVNLIKAFQINPLYQFLTCTRSIVLYNSRPSLTMLLIITLWGGITFIIGSLVFKKKQDKFIYYA